MTHTVKTLYKESVSKLKSADCPSPELDVTVIFCHTLKKDKACLVAHSETRLSRSDVIKINKLINRRKKGEPIAYITNHQEFFGLDFYVNNNVLIPRPESEWLVQASLERIMNYELRIKENNSAIRESGFTILDMGTGSGCLIVSLATKLNKAPNFVRFYACDISNKALKVAKKNADRHQLQNVRFFKSDLFSNRLLHKKYDLIFANLPYVPEKDTSKKAQEKRREGIDFEPVNAIFAADNGMATVKRFLNEASKYLNSDGQILLELDPRNCREIAHYAQTIFPSGIIQISKDLARRERYLKIRHHSRGRIFRNS